MNTESLKSMGVGAFRSASSIGVIVVALSFVGAKGCDIDWSKYNVNGASSGPQQVLPPCGVITDSLGGNPMALQRLSMSR
jgi:hypothetical protein